MSLRFFVDNLVKESLITASSNDAQFPSENIKDDRRTKVFRSISNSCNIVFDFGTVSDIDSIAIVDSNIDQIGFTTATIELNNTNSWGSPPVSQALTIDSLNGWVNFNWSTVQSYRFARLVLDNGANPVEVSKVFIGKSNYMESVCFTYPMRYSQNNRATVQTNRYGQKFFDEISTQKLVSGTIPSLNKDEMDMILEI